MEGVHRRASGSLDVDLPLLHQPHVFATVDSPTPEAFEYTLKLIRHRPQRCRVLAASRPRGVPIFGSQADAQRYHMQTVRSPYIHA